MTLTRRHFIATSAAALVIRPAFGEPLGLPAGIQLYAVRDELVKDTPTTLKALHDIGFREVEYFSPGKYTVAEYHGLIADAGLTWSVVESVNISEEIKKAGPTVFVLSQVRPR